MTFEHERKTARYLFSSDVLCAIKRNCNYIHANRIIVTNHYARDIAHLGNTVLLWTELTSISWEKKKITHTRRILCWHNHTYSSAFTNMTIQQVVTGKNILSDIYWKMSAIDQVCCDTLYFRPCHKSKIFFSEDNLRYPKEALNNLTANSHLQNHVCAISFIWVP